MRVNSLKPLFRVRNSILSYSPHTFMQGALSLDCSTFLFCSPNVMLLFSPNLSLFWTTNHRLTLFVFRTTNCLFLIQALCLLSILSSLAHCLCLSLPLVICGMQNCKSTAKSPGATRCPQPSCPITAKILWKGLVRERKPFHLRLATFQSGHSILPILPAWWTLYAQDEVMT